jgi:ACR3 family arsenite transporter
MVTLFVNWLVKPFSMALLAWLFMQHVFAAWLEPETARGYTAGLIILAAAPCTAMVFVWSHLTDGDPAYTLVQVAVNDLIMLVAFAPIVMFLCGVADVVVPSKVLITSVVVFIVIPLAAGFLTRKVLLNPHGIEWFVLVAIAPGVMSLCLWGVADVIVPSKVLITFIVIPLAAGFLTRKGLLKSHGSEWFEKIFLPRFQPVTVVALLATLVLIFAFQAENLTTKWTAVILLAIPILVQVYFNSSLTYLMMRWFKVPHNVAAPGALIGASNFFELAVAVAITLFGPSSGAALACVVGVLVEVPVMLSVCRVCNASRGWYQRGLT